MQPAERVSPTRELGGDNRKFHPSVTSSAFLVAKLPTGVRVLVYVLLPALSFGIGWATSAGSNQPLLASAAGLAGLDLTILAYLILERSPTEPGLSKLVRQQVSEHRIVKAGTPHDIVEKAIGIIEPYSQVRERAHQRGGSPLRVAAWMRYEAIMAARLDSTIHLWRDSPNGILRVEPGERKGAEALVSEAKKLYLGTVNLTATADIEGIRGWCESPSDGQTFLAKNRELVQGHVPVEKIFVVEPSSKDAAWAVIKHHLEDGGANAWVVLVENGRPDLPDALKENIVILDNEVVWSTVVRGYHVDESIIYLTDPEVQKYKREFALGLSMARPVREVYNPVNFPSAWTPPSALVARRAELIKSLGG